MGDRIWGCILEAASWLSNTLIPGAAIWIRDIAPAIAWPSVVLIVVCWFRKPLVGLIANIEWFRLGSMFEGRVRQMGRRPEMEEGVGNTSLPAATVPVESGGQLQKSPELARVVANIKADLAKIGTDKREELLVLRLAESRLSGFSEWVNNAIYGSQLDGLRKLIENGGSADRSMVEVFFNKRARSSQQFIALGLKHGLDSFTNKDWSY